MAEQQPDLMSFEEFAEWCEHQEDRYELIDGVPVLKDPLPPDEQRPGMMAGAKRRHDTIVVNAIASLRPQLRGGPCRPFSGDTMIRTAIRKGRRPDVGVECGPSDPDGHDAENPTLAIEVLSPSTRQTDLHIKIAEYQRIPTMRYILLIDPRAIDVSFSFREDEGAWDTIGITDPDATIELPSIGARLTIAELYEDVPLEAA